MKKIINKISIVAALIGCNSLSAAIVITSVGIEATAIAEAYRSDNIAKTYDLDGDDIYGSSGYLIESSGTNGVAGSDQLLPTELTSITRIGNLIKSNSSYAIFDDPTEPTGAGAVADYSTTGFTANNKTGSGGTYRNLYSFDLVSTAYDYTLRLGILAGNEGATDGRWDASGFQVTDGTTTITTDGLDTSLQMVFFDIAVTSGSTGTITILAETRDLATDANEKGGGIAGLTFDVVIPEPSSLALLLVASTSLLFVRSRKKTA